MSRGAPRLLLSTAADYTGAVSATGRSAILPHDRGVRPIRSREVIASGGLRIGVFGIAGADWIAGGQHLVNLIAAIKAADPRAAETFLVNPDSGLLANLDELGLAPDRVIRYALPRHRTPRSVLHSLARRALAVDPTANRLLADAGVRVAFGYALSYRLRRVKTVSWIPDLQHLRLPDHFSADERERRSAAYRRCLAVSDRVVVTSATVRDDLAQLAPTHAARCVVLHPASAFPAAAYQAEPREVVAAYRLPEKFFYLPNHFWTHKNHTTVLDAVRILRSRGERVVVVMTGMAADVRSPLYASEFFRKIAESGLREQLLYLGVVPRSDVPLLMRQSLAVLNPSLFEGWGYSVSEATALGKRVIVSDIPVHREQEPPDATYTPPLDAEALAGRLLAAWRDLAPGQGRMAAEQAGEEAARRLAEYGQNLLALLRATTGQPTSRQPGPGIEGSRRSP